MCVHSFSYVVRNLPPASGIAKVFVCAKTVPEVANADSKALSNGLETTEASLHSRMKNEIERTLKLTHDHVDTDFETVSLLVYYIIDSK